MWSLLVERHAVQLRVGSAEEIEGRGLNVTLQTKMQKKIIFIKPLSNKYTVEAQIPNAFRIWMVEFGFRMVFGFQCLVLEWSKPFKTRTLASLGCFIFMLTVQSLLGLQAVFI